MADTPALTVRRLEGPSIHPHLADAARLRMAGVPGMDVGRVFYFGESMLLPRCRGRGIGHAFFGHREAHARVGIAVCYDIQFPLPVRAQCEAGARVLLVPSCTDTDADANRVRVGCLARALENRCFVAAAFPTGGGRGRRWPGWRRSRWPRGRRWGNAGPVPPATPPRRR
jgi:hypothetical protein